MNVRLMMRRKYRGWRLLIITSVVIVGCFVMMIPSMVFGIDFVEPHNTFTSRHLLSSNDTSSDDEGFRYPPDYFTLEDRRNGAVVLFIIGLIYMFVALAIVCDEFFVPSLSVIIDKLKISEDVAGATFMAAGGSAPELFTSLIAVFFARDNVGIGTIVGSAVFNILFVIGMCALVSKTVLDLTWWPLFRDVSFYSIDLIVLIVFFREGQILWWQALILFSLYILYVTFMKFNSQIEKFVKTKIICKKTRVHSDNNLMSEKPHRRCSIPILHSGTSHFRHGVLQLMIHTIDPISEEHIQDKAIQLHQVASLSHINDSSDSLLNNASPNTNSYGDVNNGNVSDKNRNKKQMQVHAISNGVNFNDVHEDQSAGSRIVSPAKSSSSPVAEEGIKVQSAGSAQNGNGADARQKNGTSDTNNRDVENADSTNNNEVMDDEADEPLDMSWPSTWRKRFTYVLLAPLIIPMWLVLPDTRRPEKKKWFIITFLGSIFFIFIFSYLMVWWANETLETMGIPSSVMGLTILAAGTSIPDLITSVIVAKKGFGDMAVSSSVGSNIFDITVGLPVPWLLFAAAYQGEAINVDSVGLSCSILLLFIMLITVVMTIAVSKWKMTKIMGGAMIVLYFFFVVFSVLLELEIIPCLI